MLIKFTVIRTSYEHGNEKVTIILEGDNEITRKILEEIKQIIAADKNIKIE